VILFCRWRKLFQLGKNFLLICHDYIEGGLIFEDRRLIPLDRFLIGFDGFLIRKDSGLISQNIFLVCDDVLF